MRRPVGKRRALDIEKTDRTQGRHFVSRRGGDQIRNDVGYDVQANGELLQLARNVLDTVAGARRKGDDDPVYALDPTYGTLEIAKSEHIVDLAVNEYVFLDIQEFRTTSVLDAKKLVNGTTEGSSIRSSFGMIPMDVPGGSIKNFKETSDYKQYVEYDYPIVKLDRLTVRWIDKRGQLLDFNGFENNAFTLRFKCIFVRPDPPPPPLRDVELDRIVDALQHAPPPPKPPPEKQAWGRWVILLLVIFCIIVYVGYVRVIKPLQEKIIEVMTPKPPPPPQMKLF